jgi:hypothetical protein
MYKDFGAPVKVTLVESKKILGSFDKRLQAYAENKLAKRPNFTLVKAIVTGFFFCISKNCWQFFYYFLTITSATAISHSLD